MASTRGHIFHEFDTALQNMRDDLTRMGRLTIAALDKAKKGLVERDADACNSVIADDEAIDMLEKDIDEMCMEILVRFRPVATDLRMVMSTMSVSRNLERIADHSVNIARRGRKIANTPEVTEVQLVEPIFEMAASILSDSLQSYVDGDMKLAEELDSRDKELDKLYKKATKLLAKKIESEPEDGNTQSFLHLIFIIRSLERIGDLSVNIGEDAVFLESAEDVRHK